MGDISEGMIDGTFDCISGEYLGEGPGYPRTADGSLPWERRRSKALDKPAGPFETSSTRAREHAVHIVCSTLTEKGIKGKATRRKVLREFIGLNIFRLFQDQKINAPLEAVELPQLCYVIRYTPGGISELKQFINNQNQISKNAKSNPL